MTKLRYAASGEAATSGAKPAMSAPALKGLVALPRQHQAAHAVVALQRVQPVHQLVNQVITERIEFFGAVQGEHHVLAMASGFYQHAVSRVFAARVGGIAMTGCRNRAGRPQSRLRLAA
jgi:hypothetical protein